MAKPPLKKLRITFDHRPTRDRWHCSCGRVGPWTKSVTVAQAEARGHAAEHLEENRG